MIPESKQSQRALCAVLNGLLGACEDDVLVFVAGANDVADSDMLMGRAEQRRGFVRQLSSMVVENRGRPRTGGSSSGRIHVLLRRARDLLIGGNSGDAYGECANVERKAERVYASALAGELPSHVRALAERQHDEIEQDGQMFRRRRYLT